MAPHKIVFLFISSMIVLYVGMLQQFMLVLMWGPLLCLSAHIEDDPVREILMHRAQLRCFL